MCVSSTAPTPEDSNTERETINIPSHDEGGVLHIFTAPQDLSRNVDAAFTLITHKFPSPSDSYSVERDPGPTKPDFLPVEWLENCGNAAAAKL